MEKNIKNEKNIFNNKWFKIAKCALFFAIVIGGF